MRKGDVLLSGLFAARVVHHRQLLRPRMRSHAASSASGSTGSAGLPRHSEDHDAADTWSGR
jgi:hypothetical protein